MINIFQRSQLFIRTSQILNRSIRRQFRRPLQTLIRHNVQHRKLKHDQALQHLNLYEIHTIFKITNRVPRVMSIKPHRFEQRIFHQWRHFQIIQIVLRKRPIIHYQHGQPNKLMISTRFVLEFCQTITIVRKNWIWKVKQKRNRSVTMRFCKRLAKVNSCFLLIIHKSTNIFMFRR